MEPRDSLENECLTGEQGRTYRLNKVLGKGFTSSVYLSTTLFDSQKEVNVALKVINEENRLKDNGKFIKYFINEAILLSKIQSENVLKLYDYGRNNIQKNDSIKTVEFLVLEYAENGNILSYISDLKEGFGETKGHAIFCQILNGLNDCHINNICHRDLKLENLMLDDCYRVKLGDFGFAKESVTELHTPLGTPGYAPPEILKNKSYNGFKADIYSLGICLFGLVYGRHPFVNPINKSIDYREYKNTVANDGVNNYVKIFWEKRAELGINPSNEFKDLFLKMISLNPMRRPSTQEIINHPWVHKQPISLIELQGEFHRRKLRMETIQQERELMEEDEDEEENDDMEVESQVYRGSFKTPNSANSKEIKMGENPKTSEKSNTQSIFKLYKNLYEFNPQTGMIIAKTFSDKLLKSILKELKCLYQNQKEDCELYSSPKFKAKITIKFKKIVSEEIDFNELFDDNTENNQEFKGEEESNEKEDEEVFLIIQLRFCLDTNKNRTFIHFNKKYGNTSDFYEKIAEIKSFLK